MVTPESRLKQQVEAELKRLKAAGQPVWWLKLAGHPLQRRGIPDYLVILDGLPLFVELKAARGRLTPLQKIRGEEIRRARAHWALVRSLDEFQAAIAQLAEKKP